MMFEDSGIIEALLPAWPWIPGRDDDKLGIRIARQDYHFESVKTQTTFAMNNVEIGVVPVWRALQ